MALVLPTGTPQESTSGRVSEQNNEFSCPCFRMGSRPPSFVEDNYYCETGNTNSAKPVNGQFYSEPLWDASSCSPSTLNTPPWFYKQLQQPTTDDIEMRVKREVAKI
jgi:hypothetical protein